MGQGKRFDFTFESDTDALAEQTVHEQTKFNRSPDGGPLQTSRSASPRGDPSNLTIYSMSEIIQNIPAYGSPADALGRYEEVMNADVALSLKDGAKGDGSVLGDYMRADLLPTDMHARIGAIQLAEGIYTNQTSGSTGVADPATGTTTPGTGGVSASAAATFAELESHPRVAKIVPGFAADAREGKISPNIIWILKFLADNLGNHNLSLFIGVGKSGHARFVRGTNKESNHYTGRAVDCGIKGIPFTDMRGHAGVQVVYDLIASLHGAGVRKPYTCGGPPPQPARVSGGTLWFTNSDHWDHFHIDVSQFDGPVNPPATTGGGVTYGVKPTTTEGTPVAGGSLKIGPPIDVGQVTTRLPNQNKLHGGKIITPDAGQIDLQRQVVTLMLQLMPTEPTVKPEFYNQMLVAIIESGWAESTWRNYGHGDASSVGIFQLLSMHGSMEQRMNIDFVTRWWWKQAKGAPAKNGKGTAGQLAGQVERPAAQHLWKYDSYRNQSVLDLARLGIDARNVDP